MADDTTRTLDDEAPVIRVWRFDDAPPHLQDLSTNGGDEDWLALVPAQILAEDGLPMWLDNSFNGAFGRCECLQYPLPDGSTVVIGVHA